jgi:hypothetical protein
MFSQEIYINLMNGKAKIEKELMEISQYFSGMEVPNHDPTP